MKYSLMISGSAVVAAAMFAGCGNRLVKARPVDGATNTASASDVAPPVQVSELEPSLRGDVMRPIAELKTAHFDYDSSFLGADARATLAANAEWLKAHQDIRVQIAGHCDQRGTVAYNLALGQRRASAVREYYIHMGVPGRRIATISYGKEKLLCLDSIESCWLQNRRAETLAASPTMANSWK